MSPRNTILSKAELQLQFGFVFLISLLFWIPRENILTLLLLILFLAILHWRLEKTMHFPSWGLIVIGLSSLFAPTYLSNDVYRFLWDGELIAAGINPHDFKPAELILTELFQSEHWQQLFSGMGELSQNNYSCYPFVTEIYSAFPAFISNNFQLQVILLKLFFLATTWFAFHSLKVIMGKIPQANTRWIHFLHPLFLVEGLGNLHYEWVMLAFIVIAIRYAIALQTTWAGFYLGLAIQTKLIPLILLPFFISVIGWKKTFSMGIIALIVVIGSSAVFIHPDNLSHFMASLKLYYGRFEFNSLVYDLYLQFGFWRYGFFPVASYGIYLSKIAAAFILVTAFFRTEWNDWHTFFQRLTWAFFIYYLLATTIHPWYLMLPLLFGTLAGYRFTWIWGYAVFLTYSFYQQAWEGYFPVIKGLEYGLVISWMLIEIRKNVKRLFLPSS